MPTLKLSCVFVLETKIEQRASHQFFDQALNLHITQTNTSLSNIDFYIRMSADFLLQLAQDYLVHCRKKPIHGAQSAPRHLIKATKLL